MLAQLAIAPGINEQLNKALESRGGSLQDLINPIKEEEGHADEGEPNWRQYLAKKPTRMRVTLLDLQAARPAVRNN